MNDKTEIDRLSQRFYSLFTNRGGTTPNVAGIHELFIPEGVIVKTCGEIPAVYDLTGFIEPRERLLRDGELVDFEEEEIRERTSIMGYVAQRFSVYRKSGILRGEPFEGRGIKTMQFVRTHGSWKLSAVAWDDEREGFALDLDGFEDARGMS
ncbi:MAG TPA: hypothetical protein VIG32_12310 [Candidatus Baltobacteraceae bacterium]